MKLIPTSKFTKQSAKLLKNNNLLRKKLRETLTKLSIDLFEPSLYTHKLKGEFEGKYASRLTFELRIIFQIEKYEEEEDCILLLAIGTHDEVY